MKIIKQEQVWNQFNLMYCDEKAGLVSDEEDNENYAALIIRRDNPKFNDLVTEFTNTIILLNSKPE